MREKTFDFLVAVLNNGSKAGILFLSKGGEGKWLLQDLPQEIPVR